FIASYDSDFNVMSSSGSGVDTHDFTIPAGVRYVKVSYLQRSDYQDVMISEVEVSDSTIPSFEPYFDAYYKTIVDTDSSFLKENTPADSNAVGDAFAEVSRNVTPYKNPTGQLK